MVEKEGNFVEILQSNSYQMKPTSCLTVEEKENSKNNINNRKLMQRMIRDNGRLMELMMELFDMKVNRLD
uniref:Uncharacterized protein n=1 Tax=Nelumbo nucifera TaxID=4432 RepID=A0A822YXR5_NELNU|nr:TPA_asm: hypothetical protein HUJ06_013186 [Nelumbo nucifera]